MKRVTTVVAAGLASALAITLGACTAAVEPEGDDLIRIAASTDVYASIATAIAGDRAQVVAIIDSPTIDPHSYEASARDRLTLTTADIVIANGGGYDPFVEALLDENPAQSVLVAVELSGLLEPAGNDHDSDHDHGEDHSDGVNEHAWYDLAAMKAVATALAAALADHDPAGASTYSANTATFLTALDGLIQRARSIEDVAGGSRVVLTEPAPEYLLELVGAHNVTPAAFTRAVEAGFDVPASALLEVLRLIEHENVDLVLWNEQTSGPQLERVVTSAREARVAVISVTETLPRGLDYVGWMTANLDSLEGALLP